MSREMEICPRCEKRIRCKEAGKFITCEKCDLLGTSSGLEVHVAEKPCKFCRGTVKKDRRRYPCPVFEKPVKTPDREKKEKNTGSGYCPAGQDL